MSDPKLRLDQVLSNPYFSILKTYRAWILSLSFLFTLTGSLYIYFTSRKYTATVEIVPPDLYKLRELVVVPGGPTDLERFYAYLSSEYFMQKMIDSLKMIDYYNARGDDSIETYMNCTNILRGNIKVRISKNSSLSISYKDKNPDFCYRVILYIVEDIRQFMIRLSGADNMHKELFRQFVLYRDSMDYFMDKLRVLRERYKIVGLPDLTSGNSQIAYRVMLENPKSFSVLDEIAIYERNVRIYNEKIRSISESIVNVEAFMNLNSKYDWLIVPPAKPIRKKPNILLWSVILFLASVFLLSISVIYLYKLGFLRLESETRSFVQDHI